MIKPIIGRMIFGRGVRAAVSVDTTAPIISALSVVQNGADLDVSIDFVETGSLPIDVSIVGTLASELAPDENQIQSGQKFDGSTAPIILPSYSISAGDTRQVDIGTPPNGTYSFYAVAVDAAGNVSTIASALNVDVATTVSARVGDWLVDTTPTNTGTYTADLSSFVAGDTIMIFEGVAGVTASMTVDGQPATLEASVDSISGMDGVMFSYTLPAPGSATAQIITQWPSTAQPKIGAIFKVPNGYTIANAQAVSGLSTNPLTINHNVTKAASEILGFHMGRGFTETTWTGVGMSKSEDSTPSGHPTLDQQPHTRTSGTVTDPAIGAYSYDVVKTINAGDDPNQARSVLISALLEPV